MKSEGHLISIINHVLCDFFHCFSTSVQMWFRRQLWSFIMLHVKIIIDYDYIFEFIKLLTLSSSYIF